MSISHIKRCRDSEEKDTQASEFDPISDNEESDEGDSIQIQQTGQAPSGRSQRKQRRSIASMPERGHENEDYEPTLLLPETLTRNSACQGEFGNTQDSLRDMGFIRNGSVAILGLISKSFHLINIKCKKSSVYYEFVMM